MNGQIEAKEARDKERMEEKEKRGEERTKRLESTIEQQSEKNLYKTAFLVVIIGGSLSGLVYGLYQLAKQSALKNSFRVVQRFDLIEESIQESTKKASMKLQGIV